MNDNDSIFNKYNEKKRGLKYRAKQPRFWVNIILLIAFIIAALVVIKSFKSTWNSAKVEKSIKLVWQDTEWQEVKTKYREAMVKIVPVVSIKIKNTGDEPLQFVGIEGVFEFVSTGKAHTSGYIKSINVPLLPGKTSDKIVIKGVNGYTASSIEAFYDKIENWKKLRVKIFVRTHGSPPTRIGGIYQVKQTIIGMKEYLNLNNVEDDKLQKSLKIDSFKTAWIYKKLKKGDVVIYPTIDIKIKNIGKKDIKKLIFSAIFSFEKSGDRKQSGYPAIKKAILPGKVSENVSMMSEFGIRVSSLQSLYSNIIGWEKVRVKVLVKNIKSNYILLGQFSVKQEVRGVKVIKQ